MSNLYSLDEDKLLQSRVSGRLVISDEMAKSQRQASTSEQGRKRSVIDQITNDLFKLPANEFIAAKPVQRKSVVDQITNELLKFPSDYYVKTGKSIVSEIISNSQSEYKDSEKARKQSVIDQIASDLLSITETNLLRATSPIDIDENEEITVLNQRGLWLNRKESESWRSVVPLSEYTINSDSNPEIIVKQNNKELNYIQELAVRYLRPVTVPPPGEIVISQESDLVAQPAPPVIIRQVSSRPVTPEQLVVREKPPKAPLPIEKKLISLEGKRLPPPPRKVIIEKMPEQPPKPPAVLIERWLPFNEPKRKVIFQKSTKPDPVIANPRNLIIQCILHFIILI